MAKIIVLTEDEEFGIELHDRETEDDVFYYGFCYRHNEEISVKGRFQDTIFEIENHLDQRH